MFRLARDLGKYVGELEEEMGAIEYQEWIEVYRLEMVEEKMASRRARRK